MPTWLNSRIPCLLASRNLRMKISLAKQARARLINTKVSVFKYRLWYQRNIYRWLSVGREFTNDHRSGANTIRAKRQIKNRVRLAWRHTEKKVGRTARSVTRFISEANEKLTRRETHINNKRTHLINKIPSHPSLPGKAEGIFASENPFCLPSFSQKLWDYDLPAVREGNSGWSDCEHISSYKRNPTRVPDEIRAGAVTLSSTFRVLG